MLGQARHSLGDLPGVAAGSHTVLAAGGDKKNISKRPHTVDVDTERHKK